MLLHSMHLQNFRQHENTRVTFSRGLTGIIGTNGSGKSTLLEGIAFILYGVPATRGKKDTIKWNRGQPRAQVKGELEFTLAGHHYRVVRGLSSAEVFLDRADAPIANSLSGVSEFLSRTLGMTREEFFNTYFTGQKELQFMAGLGPTERGKFLSRVMGYDRLAAAHELLRERRKGIVSKIAGLRMNMPDFDQLAATLARETERVRVAIENATTTTANVNAVKDAFALLQPRWTSAQETREHDQRLAGDIRLIDSQVESLERDCTRLNAEWSSLVTARSEHDALVPTLATFAALRAEVVQLDRIAAVDVEQQQARGRLNTIEEQVIENAQRVAKFVEADEMLRVARGLRADAQQILDTAESACTLAINAWMESKAGASARLAQLRQEYVSLKQRHADLTSKGADGACNACGKPLGADWEAAVAQALADMTTSIEAGNAAKDALATHEATPASVTAADRTKVDAQAALRRADEHVQQCSSAASERDRLVREGEELASRAAAERKKLEQNNSAYDASRHVKVRADIESLSEADRRVAVLANQLRRYDASQQELATATAALENANGRRQSLQSQRDALGFNQLTFDALRVEVEQATTGIQQAETQRIAAAHERDRANDALTRAQADIEKSAAAREQLTALETDRVRHEELDRAYTDLRTDLNTNLRPELAELASGFLEVLTDGRYTRAEFDENYVLTLMEDGIPKPVISGGEEDLCNLVLRLAISQMIAQRAGHAFSLLILDEVFGSLDAARRNNVLQMLHGLGDRFEQVIVITHFDEMKDALDHLLHVQYDSETGSSRVVSGDSSAMNQAIDRELESAA